MTKEDEFKLLVGGYYGVVEMDEYKLKEYVLKDLEEYIKNFVALSPISGYDYVGVAEEIKDKVSIKRKLQDSLLCLRRVNGPLELIFMIKARLEELK